MVTYYLTGSQVGKEDNRMTKKNTVGLNPVYSLERLIKENTHPPDVSNHLLKDLHINNDGAAVVSEAIHARPVYGLRSREFSRYVTHEAIRLMGDCPVIADLKEAYAEFLKIRIKLPDGTRQIYNRVGDAMLGLYQPLHKGNVDVWMWNDEDARAVGGIAEDANIPKRILFAYCAGSLSELADLGELRPGLKQEYEHGITTLKYISSWLVATINSIPLCKQSSDVQP